MWEPSAQMKNFHFIYVELCIGLPILYIFQHIVNNMIPYNFFQNPFSYFTILSLYSVFIFLLTLSRAPIFFSFPQSGYLYPVFHSLLFPNIPTLTAAPTNFLVSAVTPEYILICEDLELGVSDERLYAMLVLLLTKCVISLGFF